MGNKLYSFVKAGFPVAALGLQAPELEEEAGEAPVLYSGRINLQAGLTLQGYDISANVLIHCVSTGCGLKMSVRTLTQVGG